MPKSKKIKFRKKFKTKSSKNGKKEKKTLDEISNDINKSYTIKSETPANTPLTLVKPLNNDMDLYVTPIRKKRFKGEGDEKIINESMNITNLNILFNSEFIYNVETGNNMLIDKTMSPGKRSLISFPRTNSSSPNDKTDQYTQTPDKSERFVCNGETPRGYKRFSTEKDPLQNSTPILKNVKKVSAKRTKKEVNINPYIKNVDIIRKQEGTFSDASFFSPILFQQYSSTPIDAQHRSLVENIAEVNVDRNDINSVMSPKALKFYDKNLNITPNKSKVSSKDESIRDFNMRTVNVSTNREFVSSKSIKREEITLINTHLYYSNFDIGANSSLQVLVNNSEAGCCENLFSRIKKYCKLTQYWTGKIVGVVFNVGVHIKRSIYSFCTFQNDSLQENVNIHCKRCREYHEEITKLSRKVIEVETISKENVDQLNKELQKIKEELKHEIDSLRDELKKVRSQQPLASAIPPPPPLPPSYNIPPPPPPPPPPASIFNSNKLEFKKKIKNGGTEKERPAISLQDILSVKLKKPTLSKHYQATPTSRPTNQPSVSLDMLRQVKLRPSTYPIRSASIPNNESSLDATLSPNTKLCKLLKTEIVSTGTKVKRLRRIGGLSYDSVYRRKFIDRRERGGREFDEWGEQ